MHLLKRFQRYFTKRMIELQDFSYQERLTVFNLETSEYRRLSCDLTMYYKVFHNLTTRAPGIILTLLCHRKKSTFSLS